MNTTKLKVSWTGSDWTLNIEEDTGTFIAPSMTTIISLLSALTMGGFAALLVVQEGTSIHLLDMKYAPDIANKQRLKLNQLTWETGQTSGSAWTHYNPMSREYQVVSSTNLDGVGSQVDSVYLQESSYLTSTMTEPQWSSFRSGTTVEIEDLPSLQDARHEYMVRNALDWLNDTSASQREAAMQSSYECVESQQSQYHQRHQAVYYGTSDAVCSSEEPYLWQSQIETRQETNSLLN